MASKFLWHILARFIRCYMLYFDVCLLPSAPCRCTRTYIQYMHTIDVFGELENTKLRLIRCGWEKNQRVICILQIIIAVNLQAKLSWLEFKTRSKYWIWQFILFEPSNVEAIPIFFFFFSNLIKWIYSSWELGI